MSDVDDYGEWKTGKRITGISFSGNLFFLKLGLAVAGAMVGFLLSWVRLRRRRKAQSASAINGIVLLFSVIPGVRYLITAGVVRLLKVDRKPDEDDSERSGKAPQQLQRAERLSGTQSPRDKIRKVACKPGQTRLLNSVQTLYPAPS